MALTETARRTLKPGIPVRLGIYLQLEGDYLEEAFFLANNNVDFKPKIVQPNGQPPEAGYFDLSLVPNTRFVQITPKANTGQVVINWDPNREFHLRMEYQDRKNPSVRRDELIAVFKVNPGTVEYGIENLLVEE